MVVPLYLMTRFDPYCSIVKFVVTRDIAEPAEPDTLIDQFPVAPVPVGDGISVPIWSPKFVLAVDAVDAAVPPFEIGVGALSAEGFMPPDESKLLAKLAKLTACVILVPFQV